MSAAGSRGISGKASGGHKCPKPPQLDKAIQHLIYALSTSISAALSFLHHHDLRILPSQTLALEYLITSVHRLLSSLSPSSHVDLSPLPSSWFERFLSDTCAEQDTNHWIDAFNMSTQSFNFLLSTLIPQLHRSILATPPKYALAACILRLAHGLPYETIGRWFSMNVRDSCSSFYIVCKCIMENLRFFSDKKRILHGFKSISLPNCCGIVGIRSFHVREGAAMTALMLVDSEERFLQVSVGWPSTMKTDVILSKSKLFSALEKSIPGYLLGDCSPSPLPWLLVPFPEPEDGLPPPHARFNVVHGLGMELAEMALDRVCRQWRILSKEWKADCRDFLPYVVVTCCLMHNFLLDNEKLVTKGAAS